MVHAFSIISCLIVYESIPSLFLIQLEFLIAALISQRLLINVKLYIERNAFGGRRLSAILF